MLKTIMGRPSAVVFPKETSARNARRLEAKAARKFDEDVVRLVRKHRIAIMPDGTWRGC